MSPDPLHPPVEDVLYDSGPSNRAPEPVKPQVQLFELRKEREAKELAEVLSTDAGKAVLLRVLGQANVYKTSTKFGHQDASVFDEGRRSIGIWLIAELCSLDPMAYPDLLKFHAIRQHRQAEAEAVIHQNLRASMPRTHHGV